MHDNTIFYPNVITAKQSEIIMEENLLTFRNIRYKTSTNELTKY